MVLCTLIEGGIRAQRVTAKRKAKGNDDESLLIYSILQDIATSGLSRHADATDWCLKCQP